VLAIPPGGAGVGLIICLIILLSQPPKSPIIKSGILPLNLFIVSRMLFICFARKLKFILGLDYIHLHT
jgi:hypothetical protein